MANEILRVAQNINQYNHIRPAYGGAFYLAVIFLFAGPTV
jgi:hypothetical protein